jgi:hypothetical protein
MTRLLCLLPFNPDRERAKHRGDIRVFGAHVGCNVEKLGGSLGCGQLMTSSS